MYQQDWFMRQVQVLGQMVAKLLLKKDSPGYEILDEEHLTDTDLLYLQLNRLLDEREYAEAEALLQKQLRADDRNHLSIALLFYNSLNQLSDRELEEHEFSREQVEDGIRWAAGEFGLDMGCLGNRE